MISSIQASSTGSTAALRASPAPTTGDRDAAQGDPDGDAGKAAVSAPPLTGTAGNTAAANVLTLNADSDNDNDRGGGAQPAAATAAYARAATAGLATKG